MRRGAGRRMRMAAGFVCLAASLLAAVSCASGAEADRTAETNTALELGRLYHLDGKFDEAIEVYDRGLSISPDNEKLLYNKVLALIKAKRFDEAASLAASSFSSFPHLIRFAKAQAAALELNGDNAAAVDAWTTIVELDPGDSDSRTRLMELLANMERYDEAEQQAMYLLERKRSEASALRVLVQADKSRGGTGEPWATLEQAGFPSPSTK